MSSVRPYPFLATAYLRIKRAAQHLNDLERRIGQFLQVNKDRRSFLIKLNPETDQLSMEPVVDDEGLPAMFGVIVGETVYNLRSALDYLIFDLALFRQGAEQKGTQFTIEDFEDGWVRHVERVDGLRYLRGLTPADIAGIKRCQPCKAPGFGGDAFAWLGRMRDISNEDKHRQWTVVAQVFKGSLYRKRGERGSFGSVERGEVYSTVFSDGREVDVHVYGNLGVEITLSDGSPVIQTLDEFRVKTKEVLDTFQPEFQGLAASMEEIHSEPPKTAPPA